MRAGPLSNSNVIDLLNSSFVPVFVVNEDYSRKGPAPAEEKKERERIFQEGHKLGLSVGTVHVYILNPEGKLIDSMHVAKAAKTSTLLEMLQGTSQKLGTRKGPPAVPPCEQSRPPELGEGAIALRATARSLDGRGAWSDFPVESWIVLSTEDQHSFAPKTLKIGQEIIVPRPTVEKILTHFYPATENNNVDKNKFETCEMKGRVLKTDNGRATIALEGSYKMQHYFYHKPDQNIAAGSVSGLMEVDASSGRVTDLKVIAPKSTYGGGKYAVALRSVQ